MAEFKGTREAFAQAIIDIAEKDKKVMFVSPDSLKAMRATKFAELYPKQYVEVGIAEQAAVDTAAGLAASGIIPFVGTYAGFLTMRACEQMRTFVAYPNLNVKFVGINSGLLGGEREGVTHQFYEDIGILSNIPNYTIFTPADGNQAYHAVKAAYEVEGPVYVRAGSGKEVDVYPKEAPFSKDGITILKEYGKDVLLLSCGFVLNRVLEAADMLKEQGINVTVGDINILYGKNPSKIIEEIKKAKCIVTVEDHNVNGGMGTYISSLVVEHAPKHVTKIGLNTFGESGPAKELADAYGFSAEDIAAVVKETEHGGKIKMDKIIVSVIGAGGKMGTRTSNNLAKRPDKFELLLVEASEAGIKSIIERGFTPTSAEEALEKSDVVVFAVPDTLIEKLSSIYVSKLKPGSGFIILDPAAAVARELSLRDDCTFGVAHPCHPSYFLDQDTYEARQDRFGGCGGKQDIVMSKIQGDDEKFAQCVEVAKQMYAPVEHAYVMTSEQIAFLEPTLVELLGATCLYAMAETVDEAEKRGIEREAAVSFLTGHIYNLTANFLGYIPGKPPVSDACKVAIELGNRLVMRDDWKKIWDDEVRNKVIATMLHPENPQI